MANFTFSNVQSDWNTFLKPMLNQDERVSTFPDAFGPMPADSDDTNAILRASLSADLLKTPAVLWKCIRPTFPATKTVNQPPRRLRF